MKYKIYILIPLLLLGLLSCEHDPVYSSIDANDPNDPGNPNNPGDPNDPNNPDPCDPDTIYFQNDVYPIIVSNCAISGCHGGGSSQDGVELSTYEGILDIINVNDPIDSELIEVVTETDPDDIMPPPPSNPLSQEQIDTILTWINQGAQNNECTNTDCDLTNITFSEKVWTIIQNNCTGCHSGGSPQGGISLTNYSDVAVFAGDGTLSGVINHEPGYVPMPYNANQLSQCNIDIIDEWISAGFPND